MNVITMGAHILDVLVRPVSEIPPEQGTVLVEQIRMTAAGTAAGTALTFAKLGAAVRRCARPVRSAPIPPVTCCCRCWAA
jgi:hypothetical protein